jgi:hypothetical protein
MRPAQHSLRRVCTFLSMLCIGGAAFAANECRVTIVHFGDGGQRRPLLTTVASLSVGDVSRQEIDWLISLRNDGPHDVRAALVGAPSRQLARGQVDPPQGRYDGRVRLNRLECLPARSARTPSSVDFAQATTIGKPD